MHRKLVVAVTGVPGTGKTHFVAGLERLRGTSVIEINDIVHSRRAFSGTDRFGTKIVRLGALTRFVRSEISRVSGSVVVVVGHLAPDIGVKYDIAIVLRCRLSTLERRLKGRGYPRGKINDNLLAEAFDYCGNAIAHRSREVYEVESATEKKAAAAYIGAIADGRAHPKKPTSRQIERFPELKARIEQGMLKEE